MVGRNEPYGLPEPEHRIMDTHPTMSTVLPQLVAHGRIDVKPTITEFAGNKVRFSDGSEAEADLVVYGTGYEISIPFLDNGLIFGPDRQPLLYLNVFHPELDDLFAVGLIQANGSIWRLADYQSQLVASYLIALAERHERADWFRNLKRQGHATMVQGSYVPSERHRLEANYYVLSARAEEALAPFRSHGGRLLCNRVGWLRPPPAVLRSSRKDRYDVNALARGRS